MKFLLEKINEEFDARISLQDLETLGFEFCRDMEINIKELICDKMLVNRFLDYVDDNTRIHYVGCDGKKKFPSEQSYKRFMKKNNRKHKENKETFPYECKFCGNFHLTSNLTGNE